jgi:uncharacterized protein YecT (DUF1311 family)
VKNFLILNLVVFPSVAFAELCDNPQTQTEMTYCASYHFTKADGELNDVYDRLKQGYDRYAGPKVALKAAQRAWLVFRDDSSRM